MDNLHQIFFSWLTASLKLLIKTSVVRFSYERNVFFSKNIFTISSLEELKINLLNFFFQPKEWNLVIHIFVVLLMWYGDRCFITIVNTGNFFTTKGELCSTFFSLLFFFLKSVGCLQVGYRFIPSMATICRSLSNQSNQSLPDRALESEQWHTESTCSLLFAAFFEVSLLQSGYIPYACQSRSIS